MRVFVHVSVCAHTIYVYMRTRARACMVPSLYQSHASDRLCLIHWGFSPDMKRFRSPIPCRASPPSTGVDPYYTEDTGVMATHLHTGQRRPQAHRLINKLHHRGLELLLLLLVVLLSLFLLFFKHIVVTQVFIQEICFRIIQFSILMFFASFFFNPPTYSYHFGPTILG